MATKKTETVQKSEVRIAVANVSSDLAFESPAAPAEISAAVSAAISAGTPLVLKDVRGRTIMVPADRIGFVEIGEQTERRVGFGSL
jgi:hypothetical protein